jgi:hypothetical protein
VASFLYLLLSKHYLSHIPHCKKEHKVHRWSSSAQSEDRMLSWLPGARRLDTLCICSECLSKFDSAGARIPYPHTGAPGTLRHFQRYSCRGNVVCRQNVVGMVAYIRGTFSTKTFINLTRIVVDEMILYSHGRWIEHSHDLPQSCMSAARVRVARPDCEVIEPMLPLYSISSIS